MPGLNIEEILRLHEQCQGVFRRIYETNHVPPSPAPNNFPLWKERYAFAMQQMKPLLMGMGLYLHLRRDKDEMQQIINKCVLLIKQRQVMPNHVLLSIPTLEDIINFLRPRAMEFQERIRTLPSIPPALSSLTNPSNEELQTLGGLIATPAQGPPQVSNAPPTPVPGRTTPAPSMAMPTPPHIPGQMSTNMPPTLSRQRRGGFSDVPGSMSSPAFHPSPAPITAPSPAAPSPPKGKTTRTPRAGPPAAQKRKGSRAVNTPTPTPHEVASTPTPAASAPTPAATVNPVGPKRSFEDSEAQSSQAVSQPPAKRVKTEPSPPAAPQKPPTPPPQISAPIDREAIRTVEDAKDLLTETFKKAEEQDAISQSQGQNPQDLMQWLSQLISNTADAGPSTLPSTDLGSLVGLTGQVTEAQVDGGADIEFFDYGAYFDMSAVPELDKRATLSPESHNGATTTPPSQSTLPAHSGAKAGEQKAATDGSTSLTSAVKVESVQVGALTDESHLQLMDAFLQSSGFSYDSNVEPLEEPWGAIA